MKYVEKKSNELDEKTITNKREDNERRRKDTTDTLYSGYVRGGEGRRSIPQNTRATNMHRPTGVYVHADGVREEEPPAIVGPAFKVDRTSANHAFKTVTNEYRTNKKFNAKLDIIIEKFFTLNALPLRLQ